MANGQRRSALSYIPGYKNNAVLQLVIFSATAYVMLAVSWAIIKIIYAGGEAPFHEFFVPNIALGEPAIFRSHWWTLLTYGWFQYPNSFMELLSSMLWLYCFGSVVQMLVGHRQVVPLYFYALLIGGAVYELAQLLPGNAGNMHGAMFLGGRAGIMAMAVAAIALSPNYRFYLTETFTIPLAVVVGVFAVLMLLGSGFNLPILLMLLAASASGFAYVRLLRAGYRPAEWMFRIVDWFQGLVTPSEKARQKSRITLYSNNSGRGATARPAGNMQGRVDELLDKINLKGYNSLTTEEKDFLQRAGKE